MANPFLVNRTQLTKQKKKIHPSGKELKIHFICVKKVNSRKAKRPKQENTVL